MINRSPGYPISFVGDFEWPDVSLVPKLKMHGKKWENGACAELRSVIGSNGNFPRSVDSFHNKIAKTLGDSKYLSEFFKRLKREYAQEQKTLKSQKHTDKILKGTRDLAENGFFKRTLPKNDINDLRELFSKKIKILQNKKPDRSYRIYDRSISHARDKVCKRVNGILSKNGIVQCAQEYFGFPRMAVQLVVLHISYADDVHFRQVLSDTDYCPKTVGLHFDPKSGTIKCILYLKDITENDGPFTYVPQSHRLSTNPLERLAAKSNCTVNYLDSDNSRKEFMNLPDILRKTSIIGTVTDDKSDLSKNLLSREKSFTSDHGNVIAFDPGMLHRGGICKGKGYRTSLQIAIREI